MIFLGSKPGPSLFNFLNCFVTLNLFWLLSSARVGAAFELALRRICDWPLFNSLRDWLVLVRGPALRSIRSLREGREPGKKIEDPTDRIEWALWSRSSGRVDLTRTKSHQFKSLRGSTFFRRWASISVSEKFLIELIKFSIFQGKKFGSALLTDADQIAFEPGSLKGLNSISSTLSFNQGCQLTVSTISLERVYSRPIKAKNRTLSTRKYRL